MDERRPLGRPGAPRLAGTAHTSPAVMDREAVRVVLASVAPRRRASRLDRYASLIRSLRRRGHSYRDIVAVLHDRCGVRVGLHTLYHFARTRARTPTHGSARRRPSPPARSSARADAVAGPLVAGDEAVVRARIEALKQRAPASPVGEPKAFEYDEHTPLQLMADITPPKR